MRLLTVFLPEWAVAKLSPRRVVYRGKMIDPKAHAVGKLIEVMRPAGEIPLPEEGRQRLRAVADKLSAAGVAVTHKHSPGQIHGFISLTKVIPQGTEALAGIANWLKSRA